MATRVTARLLCDSMATLILSCAWRIESSPWVCRKVYLRTQGRERDGHRWRGVLLERHRKQDVIYGTLVRLQCMAPVKVRPTCDPCHAPHAYQSHPPPPHLASVTLTTITHPTPHLALVTVRSTS